MKYRTYSYNLLNPEKCLNGMNTMLFKSSWEKDFAHHCDILPDVLSWGYEIQKIPYKDPLTGKQKVYFPDFFVTSASKGGYQFQRVYEIKPMHEQLDERARSKKDAANIARNRAKWTAAVEWCERHSAEFIVLNESNLYLGHQNRPLRKHPIKKFAHTHKTAKKKLMKNPATKRKKKSVSKYSLITKLRKKGKK